MAGDIALARALQKPEGYKTAHETSGPVLEPFSLWTVFDCVPSSADLPPQVLGADLDGVQAHLRPQGLLRSRGQTLHSLNFTLNYILHIFFYT